jgi:hypothetical protein
MGGAVFGFCACIAALILMAVTRFEPPRDHGVTRDRA